jgi:hypothetical protein
MVIVRDRGGLVVPIPERDACLLDMQSMLKIRKISKMRKYRSNREGLIYFAHLEILHAILG